MEEFFPRASPDTIFLLEIWILSRHARCITSNGENYVNGPQLGGGLEEVTLPTEFSVSV